MIVAIEGGDAGGKATQSKILAERLGAERIAFPDYETPCGQRILGLLKEEWACCAAEGDPEVTQDWFKVDSLNVLVLQSLMTTNRLELLPKINQLTSAGKSIVFDRFWASGIIYGELDGLDRKWIETIQAPLPKPDLWILIDVSEEESIRRRPERRDRYEKDPGFMDKVRKSYLHLFGEKSYDKEPWMIVNGEGTVEEVAARVWRVTSEVLKL